MYEERRHAFSGANSGVGDAQALPAHHMTSLRKGTSWLYPMRAVGYVRSPSNTVWKCDDLSERSNW